MKKFISVIISFVVILSAFAYAGCGEGEQLELQNEFLEDVRRMSLLINPDYPKPEDIGMYAMDVVTDEIIFLPRCYELYCHAYMIFEGKKEPASAAEVRELFVKFDEEVYERFRSLSSWYLYAGGNMFIDRYNEATAVARDLYNEKYSDNILPGNWTAWSLEDRIALEDFIRDNPDLMPADEYEKELRHMGIIE